MLRTKGKPPKLTRRYLAEIGKGQITGKCPPLQSNTITPIPGKQGAIYAKLSFH